MVFKRGNNWFLRGIVSIGTSRETAKSLCSLEDYVVFTDIAQYKTWIGTYVQMQ